MRDTYFYIKENATLPIVALNYTTINGDVINPFNSISMSFNDSDDFNISKMESLNDMVGDQFLFFNNSPEGENYFRHRTINKKNDEDVIDWVCL
jgi:hypothetical protein